MNFVSFMALAIFILIAGMSIERIGSSHHLALTIADVNQQHQEELARVNSSHVVELSYATSDVVPLVEHERVVNENTKHKVDAIYRDYADSITDATTQYYLDALRRAERALRICEQSII